MQDSFLNYRGFFYFWATTLLLLAILVTYIVHEPFEGPNGGSWLGYTLGTIGAVLIVWLMLFGLRKRTYNKAPGSLKGWLSAHVYLGGSLILIATLHTGFQFGWNIHTLAYTLMMLVILSGFFGIFIYVRYPTLMTRNRANTVRAAMLEEVAELDEESLKLADELGPKCHQLVVKSVDGTKIGGGVWAQLTGADATESALDETKNMLEDLDAAEKKKANTSTVEMPTMFAMVDFLSEAGGEDAERLRRLMDLLSRKKALASKVARDVQYQAVMEIWLYLHVPLSFALLGALTAHIVSVFFYW